MLIKVSDEWEKMLVAARAEKEANELRNKALTPTEIEKMWIEKWDGKLPSTYAGEDILGIFNIK